MRFFAAAWCLLLRPIPLHTAWEYTMPLLVLYSSHAVAVGMIYAVLYHRTTVKHVCTGLLTSLSNRWLFVGLFLYYYLTPVAAVGGAEATAIVMSYCIPWSSVILQFTTALLFLRSTGAMEAIFSVAESDKTIRVTTKECMPDMTSRTILNFTHLLSIRKGQYNLTVQTVVPTWKTNIILTKEEFQNVPNKAVLMHKFTYGQRVKVSEIVGGFFRVTIGVLDAKEEKLLSKEHLLRYTKGKVALNAFLSKKPLPKKPKKPRKRLLLHKS